MIELHHANIIYVKVIALKAERLIIPAIARSAISMNPDAKLRGLTGKKKN